MPDPTKDAPRSAIGRTKLDAAVSILEALQADGIYLHDSAGDSLTGDAFIAAVTKALSRMERACAEALAPTPKEWRCFHCDEVFTDEADAREHFGADMDRVPACRLSAEDVKQLRALEALNEKYRHENEQLDYEAGAYHAMSSELERLFGKGVLSAHQAWLRWEEQESRAMAAEERLAALETSRADALAPPEPGWQPMNTFPHDGSPCLCWVDDHHLTAHVMWKDGHLEWLGGGRCFHTPTHWMPLPAPPRADALAAPPDDNRERP